MSHSAIEPTERSEINNLVKKAWGCATGAQKFAREGVAAIKEAGLRLTRLTQDLPSHDFDTLIEVIFDFTPKMARTIVKTAGAIVQMDLDFGPAGAQLAALLCTDNRYLKAEGVPFNVLKGCVPVDGDTYDVPAIIMTVEIRQTVHGLPLPEFGHRVKFGNDPEKHLDLSAVAHVSKDKGIPPFLILHVAGHPNVRAQALRLGAVLKEAGVPAKVFGARETTHNQLTRTSAFRTTRPLRNCSSSSGH